MTIANVAVSDPVLASTMNQLVANVNASPGRAVFVANGTWSVPSGVHKFKVTLCGGGGAPLGDIDGGDSPLISAILSGIEIGTTIVITIGDGSSSGTGGTTSFGTYLSSAGGQIPANVFALKGNPGAGSWPGGAPTMIHSNELFGFCYGLNVQLQGYGRGALGAGTNAPGTPGKGNPGICVIEW